MAVDITIEELTNGELINKEWVGTGIFDKLISAVNLNIESQRAKGYITGEKYGDVYLGSMQSVIAQSMQFLLQEKMTEAQIELTAERILTQAEITKKAASDASIAADNEVVSLATRQDKIDKSSIDLYVTDSSKDHRITLAGYQATKVGNEASYVGAQQTAMEEQVIDNRIIKALSSLSDTYGTFGSGGLTMSSDMWAKYFELVELLAGGIAPTSTTVTKVT